MPRPTGPQFEKDTTVIYHGSPHTGFKEGDIIKSLKGDRGGFGEQSMSDNRVFGTNWHHWANMYATQNGTEGKVYRVEPVGDLQRYKESDVAEAAKKDFGVDAWEYSAPAWRVLGDM